LEMLEEETLDRTLSENDASHEVVEG
jgi:hypothetical protein